MMPFLHQLWPQKENQWGTMERITKPRQTNFIDCGFYVMLFAAYYAYSEKLPDQIPHHLVKKAVHQCIRGSSLRTRTVLSICQSIFECMEKRIVQSHSKRASPHDIGGRPKKIARPIDKGNDGAAGEENDGAAVDYSSEEAELD